MASVLRRSDGVSQSQLQKTFLLKKFWRQCSTLTSYLAEQLLSSAAQLFDSAADTAFSPLIQASKSFKAP